MIYKTEEDAIADAKANVDVFADFDGQNCGDIDGNFCAGWDGESHRCDCGNRRVYWATIKHSDGTFTAHAEAY